MIGALPGANDPFEVEYWGVTVDWSLIGFDRKKRRQGASQLPVVLHPSNLLQLMQFWVPRTESLEDGLIDALRLPLLFQSFDPIDEKATIQVLEAISRFENVDDIPEPTLRVILANKALRVKLREATASNDEVFELVREEFVAEHREAVARLETVEASLGESNRLREAERLAAEVEQRRLLEEGNSKVALADGAQRELAFARERLALEEGQKKQMVQKLHRQERIIFFMLFVVVPSLVGAALCALVFMVLQSGAYAVSGRVLLSAAAFAAPVAFSFCIAPTYLVSRAELSRWPVARSVAWLGKKLVLLPLGLIFAGVVQGAAWDSVKLALPGRLIPSAADKDSSVPENNPAPVIGSDDLESQ